MQTARSLAYWYRHLVPRTKLDQNW